MDAADLKRDLIAQARSLGFDIVRVTAADLAPDIGNNLRDWLAAGSHGDMAWMEKEPLRRMTPGGLWPEARSVVVLGVNYGPETNPADEIATPGTATISAYARGADYHDVLKKRLKTLGRWLHQASGAEIKIFVDTAPIMEKPLAAAAGLGWQGKHTNLVSREFGSWLFLAEIFTAMELPPDPSETDHCGQCRRCLDACPTAAFPAPYRLDARRCISYLTIEHKGPIPTEFRAAMGNRIYGCDDCLAVCPWNKFARRTGELAFHARTELTAPVLTELAGLDDDAFRRLFAGSPIKRIGRARFVRNVLIALGNSGRSENAGAAEVRLDDEAPLIRGMAVWALARLDPQRLARAAASHAGREADPAVRAEWDDANVRLEMYLP
ncbi:MAG: epoxyqueuosine reductase [Aliidongia sp.]|nr:epoxyqueuosine reductase [Aliidongia sp.]